MQYLQPHLAQLAARGIKVVSNAGGVNPEGCKTALLAACAAAGVSLRVATVTGDDVLPWIEHLRMDGVREAASQAELPDVCIPQRAPRLQRQNCPLTLQASRNTSPFR